MVSGSLRSPRGETDPPQMTDADERMIWPRDDP
jgi:hypothetical protein